MISCFFPLFSAYVYPPPHYIITDKGPLLVIGYNIIDVSLFC